MIPEEVRTYIIDQAERNAKFLNLAKRGHNLLRCYLTAFEDGATAAVLYYQRMMEKKRTER